MMPAVGAKFVLLGASEEDLKVLQEADAKIRIYDEEWKNQFIRCEELPIDSIGRSVVLDLRNEGELQITLPGTTKQGKIFYKGKDRAVLLEQILLMLTGERYLDADSADIMPTIGNGSFFYWTVAETDEIVEKGIALVREAIKATKANNANVFLQLCGDEDLVACAELLAAVEKIEGINMLIPQGVSAELIGDKSAVAVFIQKL